MLKQLLILEKKTLLRGVIVTAFYVFPFTFVPVVFSRSNTFRDFVNRVPESLLYTLLFACLVVVAAVIDNFQKLQVKDRLLRKAAFGSLGFQMQLEGAHSITKELSPFLMGIYGRTWFYVGVALDGSDGQQFRIRISPLFIDHIPNKKALANILKRYYPLTPLEDLCIELSPKADELDQPAYLSKHLAVIDAEIQKLLPASEII